MRSLLSLLFVFSIFSSNLIAAEKLPSDFHDSIIVKNLYQPVACEFTPDGRLFILQKQGIVRIVQDGNLIRQPALKIQVNTHRERGLGGIAFDPSFSTNGYVYLFYTAVGQVQNRLSRFTVVGNVIDPASEKVLLDQIASTGVHNAGCLRFGKGDELFISTGDGGGNPNLAQKLSSINGKILRINKDGTIPPDNPFFGDTNRRPEIWAYGFRNPWRFALDPQNGRMIIADVGEDDFEEIDIGKAGGNYGWPMAEGTSANKTFVNPIFTYPHLRSSAAVTGAVVYRGKTFPAEYQGAFFYGDYARGFIRYLTFHPNGTLESDHDFAIEAGPVVHITQGPDDALYYVLFNGQVRRIQFEKGRNDEPIAEISSDVRFGSLPLTVHFSADDSFDPEGEALKYRWQFGDGAGAVGKNVTHTYRKAENFQARCVVSDARGAQAVSDTVRIFAGDRPPIPVIDQPKAGATVRTGQRVRFSGFANDTEDGSIDASKLVWTVILLHNDHTHPFLGPIAGSKSGSFLVPHRHGAGFLAYRVRLKATDSRGLSIMHQVDVTHLP